MDLDADRLFGMPAVRKLAGDVTDATILRWQRDPEIGFPRADCVMKNRQYWRASTLARWQQRMAAPCDQETENA